MHFIGADSMQNEPYDIKPCSSKPCEDIIFIVNVGLINNLHAIQCVELGGAVGPR